MLREYLRAGRLGLVTLLALGVATACTQNAGGEPAAGGRTGGAGRTGGRGPGRGLSDRPTPVEIETVRRGSVSRTSTIAGMLEPLRVVGVNAQVAGILLSVNTEEGRRVRLGDTMAAIDVTELEAQARSADASLRFAQSTLERSERLFKEKIITEAELQRDRAAFESARASTDQLRTRLGYANVVAPIAGMVTEKRIEAGDIVGNQTRLFTLADVSVLVTRVQVSELEVSNLSVGDHVPLTVDALGGERVDGRIRRIFPSADTSTRLVPVEVALTGRQLGRLRPGYTVRATFALDRRDDALLVPSRAISGPAGARAVFVVTGGEIHRRAVSVGSDVGGMTEVLNGLVENDSVIVSGSSLLREGNKARIVSPLGDEAPSGVTMDSTTSSTTTPQGRRGGRGQ